MLGSTNVSQRVVLEQLTIIRAWEGEAARLLPCQRVFGSAGASESVG